MEYHIEFRSDKYLELSVRESFFADSDSEIFKYATDTAKRLIPERNTILISILKITGPHNDSTFKRINLFLEKELSETLEN